MSELLSVGELDDFRLGRPDRINGRVSHQAVQLGAFLVMSGRGSALVTAPISKEAWHLAGVPFVGHTEYLERFTRSSQATMVMTAGHFHAATLTRHVPLSRVAGMIKSRALLSAARDFYKQLGDLLGRRPKIGLCGLNPHAGESGLLGKEEKNIIRPVVQRLRNQGFRMEGPLAADTAWRLHRERKLDGLVTLYHDQAMIPLKVLEPQKIVNWTLGLPFIRTSPGHGTAFDIAGKGKADPQPMIEAILLAANLANRKNGT